MFCKDQQYNNVIWNARAVYIFAFCKVPNIERSHTLGIDSNTHRSGKIKLELKNSKTSLKTAKETYLPGKQYFFMYKWISNEWISLNTCLKGFLSYHSPPPAIWLQPMSAGMKFVPAVLLANLLSKSSKCEEIKITN